MGYILVLPNVQVNFVISDRGKGPLTGPETEPEEQGVHTVAPGPEEVFASHWLQDVTPCAL
jgi:hypothetical protein